MPRVSVLGGVGQRGDLTWGLCCCNCWSLVCEQEWVWGKGNTHVWYCYVYQEYKIFSAPNRKLKIAHMHRNFKLSERIIYFLFFLQKSSLVAWSQNFLHQSWKNEFLILLCWRPLSSRSWVNKICYHLLILTNLFCSDIPLAWPHSTGNRGGGGEESCDEPGQRGRQ